MEGGAGPGGRRILRGCGLGLLGGTCLVVVVAVALFVFIAATFDLGGYESEDDYWRDHCDESRGPLIAAAARGDLADVEDLVDEGVDLDEERKGETALTCASANHDLAMMTLLLDRGATSTTDALHAAVSLSILDDEESVESLEQEDAAIGLLLEHGADPDGGSEGPSPLLTVAWDKRPDTVALLLRHGADPDYGGRVDSSVLYLAQVFRQGSVETVPEGLLPTPQGETVANVSPLIGAAWAGQRDIATQLLDVGADPNLTSDEAFTPVLAAAVQGDEGMVELLLARGASPTPTVRAGVLTPAEAAREAGHKEVAALLAAG